MNRFATIAAHGLASVSSALSAQAKDVPASGFERDCQAILAMAGEFRVEFNFAETVSFQHRYSLAKPKHSSGNELVVVTEDEGPAIELQHILVLGESKRVVKHWRQRWEYENRTPAGCTSRTT